MGLSAKLYRIFIMGAYGSDMKLGVFEEVLKERV
jgi:hypothetical protein